MSILVRGGRWADGPVRRGGTRRNTSSPNSSAPPADKNILSFVLYKKTLAAALFDVNACEVHVVEAQVDDEFEMAARIKAECNPVTVVLPKALSSNEKFLTALFGEEAVSRMNAVGSDVSEGEEAGSNRTETARTDRSFRYESKGTNVGNGNEDESSDRIALVPSTSNNNTARRSETATPDFYTMPGSQCTVEKARQALSFVQVLAMPEKMTAVDRVAYLGYIFDHHVQALRAFGVLITFSLDNLISATHDFDELVRLNAIKYGELASGMQMSSTTVRSLVVFQEDAHPAGHGMGQGKEWGLFGIFGAHLRSNASFRVLRSWLRSPLIDEDAIADRQIVVNSFSNSANANFVSSIRDALRGVKDVKNILKRIRQIAANVNDWQHLFNSVKHFLIVIESFRSAASADRSLRKSNLGERVRRIDVDTLRSIVNYIDSIIDFEESKVEKRLCVKQGFSVEIDQLHSILSSIDSLLTRVGIEEMKKVMSDKPNGVMLSSLVYHFETNIGFLARLEEKDVDEYGLDGLQGAGFEFEYSTQHGYYFKDKRCHDLDEELGDVHGTIVGLEAKLRRFLEAKITANGEPAYEAAEVMAEIDCLQAFASVAEEYKWVRPIVSKDVVGITIENGRHCLMEMQLSNFVPNSTQIRVGDVHVITGPNYSGKSVFLKTVALIVILAQVGSCVPAANAEVHPVRAIFTCVSSFDSISTGQSTFFADCSQVAGMLNGLQSNAALPVLAILDEFGKGTSEVDGLALHAALLKSLLERDDKAVMCICATHHVEVFKLLPMESPKLGTFSFEMVPADQAEPSTSKTQKTGRESTPNQERLSEQYVRTYRLMEGTICSESRAIQCALEQGMPRHVLGNAMRIKQLLSATFPSDSPLGATSNNANDMLNVGVMNARTRVNLLALDEFLRADLHQPSVSRSRSTSATASASVTASERTTSKTLD